MSYCRWSSDDYQCDVYVYEDCGGGWTAHVAARRTVFAEPLPPTVPLPDHDGDWSAWLARDAAARAILDRSTLEAIDLPHAGETFNDPTPGDCADRLERLRALGYRVPEYAVAELREEMAAMPVEPKS